MKILFLDSKSHCPQEYQKLHVRFLFCMSKRFHHHPKRLAAISKTTEGTAKKSGRDAIIVYLMELIAHGFIVRTKRSDGKMDYTVFDEPVEGHYTPQTEAFKVIKDAANDRKKRLISVTFPSGSTFKAIGMVK